jgi:hypothetical protein
VRLDSVPNTVVKNGTKIGINSGDVIVVFRMLPVSVKYVTRIGLETDVSVGYPLIEYSAPERRMSGFGGLL